VLTRIFRWVAVVGISVLLASSGSYTALADTPSPADSDPPGTVIRVGIKPLDPFVNREGDHYRGFSIDLWNEIARRNGWQTSYIWHEDLPSLLSDVQNSAVDAAISGITITKDREAVLDFSYPMFSAGLEVMTTRTGPTSFTSQITSVLTAGVGRYLLALLVALVAAGHIIWLATRRRTRLSYLPGLGLGIYKAAGLGLVGDYGVAEPERPLARAAAVIWTIIGMSFVSLFTATLASQLTVHQIQNNITGVQDLKTATVATITGSSAEAYLREHGIGYTGLPSINDAYRQLDDGQIEAIVFDAPVLQNHLKTTPDTDETLVGGIFARENYGIAVPNGSPLRKKINTTLLDIIADGTYDDLYTRYFNDQATK
jgi:ABC-type amino acid transport substrate-binding protein